MTITHDIKIDLVRPEIVPPVKVVQGDTYTRKVKVSLYAAGTAWDLPAGHDIAIRYCKHDGTSGNYDTLPDGSVAWSSEGNTVSVMLCPQMLTVPGSVPTQVSIIVGDSVISTFTFIVNVAADPSKGAMKSESYNNWRKAFIPQTDGARVGQYLQIAEVDADGRTIAVAAVDDPAADAKTYANTAVDRANAAALTAETAQQTADIALGQAEQAIEALQKVSDAKDIADEAQSTADQALEKADDAFQNIQRIEDELQDHSDYIGLKLTAPAKATVRQFVRVAAVDSSGKITATEAVDAPNAGSDAPDYVRAEAERVAAVAQGRKNANTVTFIACSDLHHSFEISTADQQTESLLHMGQAMGIIRQQVQIDFAAVLGDLVWDHGESVDNALRSMRYANSCLHAGFNGIPNLRDRGNHDCLYNGDGLTNSQIYANIFAYNSGAVFGDRVAGYCYRDFEDYKLRVILVNTCEDGNGDFAVSEAQIAWLSGALSLAGKGDGWRSIVLGHHPPDWASSGSALVQTLKAASGLIAVFHGHVHGYKVDKIPGTEITRIAIPNACYGRENEYGQNSGGENAEGTEFGEDITYQKTAGTAQDTAFCVVTIDLAQKKIYADHYGAGYSRVIPFDDVVLNSYSVTKNLTNVSISNAAVTVTEGASYTAVLTAAQGYELDVVTVTMGGVDITATVYNGGVVSIQNVTGDVVIMATATEVVEPEPPAEGYTNLVRTSKNADGSIYNGTGYQTGYRLNSSGTTTAAAGAINCGFIPYSGEVIRVYGSTSGTQGTTGNYVAMYDAGHNKIGVYDFAGWVNNGGIWEAIDGKYMLTIDPAAITNTTMQSTLQDAKYIRCSMALCTAEDFTVTLDEPIE